jgi:signal transduction histidine kinase
MDLAVAERRLDDDPDAARKLLTAARAQTADALAELRSLSRGIAPPILADRGLGPSLVAVAARCTVQVDLQVGLPEGTRLTPSVENAAYFVVSEALANVAKHSQARHVGVRVLRDRSVLRVEVEDDGVGGAHPSKGHGLIGLADRLAALDGTLNVSSAPGGPTLVVAEVPCG